MHSEIDTMVLVTCYALKIETQEGRMKNIQKKKLGRP
jgi:hypothetical protein